MGCYLVCHFSGLWASLMSTLIPLRSGAGVYATLGEKRRKIKFKKKASDSQLEICGDQCSPATPGPPRPRLRPQTAAAQCRIFKMMHAGHTEKPVNLSHPCGLWVLSADVSGCRFFFCLFLLWNMCSWLKLPLYHSHKFHNYSFLARWNRYFILQDWLWHGAAVLCASRLKYFWTLCICIPSS